jgi:8-oxo-dGTP pyrophosphatase MutT (NUDIX family)
MIEVMPEPEAAVAVVHAREPADSILLMRRAVRDGDPWSGHWSFPGGRCDPRDEDPLHTALRELAEECGIHLTAKHLETSLEPTPAGRAGGHAILVAPFVFRVDGELPTILDAAEVDEVLWMPLRLLRDPGRHCLRPVPGRPPETRYPSIDLDGAPLWGFTFRLITSWLGLVAQDSPAEQAGFQVASSIVAFLLDRGLKARGEWRDRHIVLEGSIPTAAVLSQFCVAGAHVQAINMLEVLPQRIRLLGLAFEEYAITAVPS